MQHSVHDLHLALLPAAQEAGRLGGTTGPDLSRYFLVCAILIAVTAGVAWGLKKLLAHNLQVRASQRSLKVLDVLGLGGKRQVAVVRCYDRTFVLGLGEREVSPIAELDPVIGSDEAPETPRPADRAAFAQALEQVRKALPKALQPGGRSVTPLPAEPAPTFATSDAIAQPLVQDAIEPSLQAELERRYQAASERLAETGNVQPYTPPTAHLTTEQQVPAQVATTQAAPSSTTAAPAPKKRVLRKVIRKRSQEESDRARSVASAALEMAATMKRERAAAAERSAPAPAIQVQAADAVPAPLPAPVPAPKPESPPTLRLEGVLG